MAKKRQLLPVVDPTVNVKADLKAAVQRQDDLRIAERRFSKERLKLISRYENKLRKGEARRINAIRAVDVAAVASSSRDAAAAALALATQVATTKDAFAVNLETALKPMREDIAALRVARDQDVGAKTAVVERRISTGQIVAIVGVAGALVITPLTAWFATH